MRYCVLALAFSAGLSPRAVALELSVPRVNGDVSRTLLGDGTGVIVGIIDSGVDDLHPALMGLDSLANPRLVAEANFVATEPGNSGDDVQGRGTAVAAVVLGNDVTNTGLATDARYINSRTLSSSGTFNTDAWVVDAAGFAVDNGADIVNMTLSLSAVGSDGSSRLSLMSDYIAQALDIPVVVSAGENGNEASPQNRPRGPADAFNVFSVAASEAPGYNQVADFSSFGSNGPLEDGRIRPNISAPGQAITTANDDHEIEPDFEDQTGTRFAAPHVSGMLAQQIEYGRDNGLSTDTLVLKATMLNSAEKIDDRDGNAWEPFFSQEISGVFSTDRPLDNQSGTGQIDGARLAEQFMAGEQGWRGGRYRLWDLNAISDGETIDYVIDGFLAVGSTLTATLNWHRHVGINDDGDGVIDSGDTFFQSELLDNLDLSVLLDGNLIAESVSTVDNIEHLHLPITQSGQYTIRVSGTTVGGSPSEAFGLAWFGTALSSPGIIPEPASGGWLGAILVATLAMRRRRSRAR